MLAATAYLFGQSANSEFSIRWIAASSDSNRLTVEVSGLSRASLRELRKANWDAAQWQKLFAVYTEQGNLLSDIALPAMLGTHRVENGKLRFEPQFPLEPGVTYRATFQPSNLPDGLGKKGLPLSSTLRVPARPSKPTTVVRQVYPSVSLVPENLLKFYVHFSAPMSRGHIYDYIHLKDEKEKDVELPFLEIDEELWDPTMTRLTLFIDPGRIKREVKPLEDIGPALENGKSFTLVIDSAWKDAVGNTLVKEFRKPFRVGPPDREPPDPNQWKVQAPRASTSEVLAVTFPEPLDHALAERMIHVTDRDGKWIPGRVMLHEKEQEWTFSPERSWRQGSYRISVQTTIEDLAGNNVGKPFEVDLIEPVQRHLTNATVTLTFEVR